MKKTNLFTMLISVAAVVSLIIVGACTKEGPQGPPGENGTDGNATCGTCHDNSETVETKIGQWEKSFHATSGLQFENRTTCAPCHTSQGFKEALALDSSATAAAIENPANINCYTCHKIHDSYSTDDWALRVTEPSPFWLTGETADLGKANLCIKCHQERTSYAIPDVNTPDGIYTVSSTRFGPHYGVQGTSVSGIGFYEVGTGYMNSPHSTIEDACINCHMASAIGYATGGHTWIIEDEEEGFNENGCLACHTTAGDATALKEELLVEITDLMTQLGTKLVAAGIYNPNATSGYAVKGDYTNTVAGAFWNFMCVMSDGSGGVHNPTYIKKVLENSIASLP
jgi:hypothetical protein